MLIPLGVDVAFRRRTPVTPLLVAVNVLAYAGLYAVTLQDPESASEIVGRFQVVGGERFVWWSTVTYAFLHGSWMHVLSNMLFLWVFGKAVEQKFGSARFLAYYLAGAVLAGLAHAVFEKVQVTPRFQGLPPGFGGGPREAVTVYVPAIGASGAVAAVTGAFLVFFPLTRVRTLWLLGFVIWAVPAWWIIGLGIVVDFFSQSLGIDNGVANIAHLAGYGFGIGLCLALLGLGGLSREPTDLFTMLRQLKRRRDLRTAFRETERQRARLAGARPGDADGDDARSDELAEARAAVSIAVAEGRLDDAGRAYADLTGRFSEPPSAATLARGPQHAVATHLYSAGEHELAAEAFRRFAEAYPSDPETPAVRLLLGRLYALRLGRPRDARPHLEAAVAQLRDESYVALAQETLGALPREGAR